MGRTKLAGVGTESWDRGARRCGAGPWKDLSDVDVARAELVGAAEPKLTVAGVGVARPELAIAGAFVAGPELASQVRAHPG